jgi:hypothetical protein
MANKQPEYGFRLAGEAVRPGAVGPTPSLVGSIPQIPLAAKRGMARVAPPEENPRLVQIRKKMQDQIKPTRQEQAAVQRSAFMNYKDLL